MTAPEISHKLTAIINLYTQALDMYTDEQFAAKPTEGSWSLGQLYEHLLQANNLFVKKIKGCLTHQYGSTKGGKTADGEKMFKYGSFPPVKIQPPEAWRGPDPVAQGKEFYQTTFPTFLQTLLSIGEQVEKDNGAYKTNHPVLGMLTAEEWYGIVEMHFRHHLRQKKEIESFLNIS